MKAKNFLRNQFGAVHFGLVPGLIFPLPLETLLRVSRFLFPRKYYYCSVVPKLLARVLAFSLAFKADHGVENTPPCLFEFALSFCERYMSLWSPLLLADDSLGPPSS